MELLPIYQTEAENTHFAAHPAAWENVQMWVVFYKRIGFSLPWIGYMVRRNDEFVGGVGFVGKPVNNTVEIAYGTFPAYQKQGIASEGCQMLVQLARQTDPAVRVIAHTLPEENYSTKILKKNGFQWVGLAHDDDEGTVWEWAYQPTTNQLP
jgi:[ribosomal protein S5]-alanine N-acetyltransferase